MGVIWKANYLDSRIPEEMLSSFTCLAFGTWRAFFSPQTLFWYCVTFFLLILGGSRHSCSRKATSSYSRAIGSKDQIARSSHSCLALIHTGTLSLMRWFGSTVNQIITMIRSAYAGRDWLLPHGLMGSESSSVVSAGEADSSSWLSGVTAPPDREHSVRSSCKGDTFARQK